MLHLLLYTFLAIILFTTSSQAQTTPEETTTTTQAPAEATPPPADGRIEKLEVTGSHIRRTDVEGPSPVLTIDRQQIEKSGFNDVGEILRRSTVSPFGGDGSTVSLKGIGAGRTLVLINGQRAPGSGSSYADNSVSTNFVPIAAVERIEVLKDGASATYGSDALGGVINIITKKDLDGFSFANKYDMTNVNGGDSNLTSLAYGTQTAKTNVLTSLQVRYGQGNRSSDFTWAKELNKSFPFSTNYINDAGEVSPGPDCTQLNSLGRCEEFVSPMQVTKESYSADWVTDMSIKVGADTTFYTTLIAGYGRGGSSFPNIFNTPGIGTGLQFAGPTPAAWNTLPGYSGGGTQVFHRMDDYVNTSLDQNYYGGLITGLKGYFGDSDWQWDVTANNQINIAETNEYSLATVSGTRAAVLSGQYNPFNRVGRNTAGMGIDAFNRNRSVVNWVEAKTNGELGHLLGFDWSAAFGTSMAHFEYADHRNKDILNNNVMLQSGVAGRGARELYSVFAEFSGMLANQFEAQVSLRGDFYSDFGNTFNPKLAFRYQPTRWLTLRTSAGTGFQAPTLQNMNTTLEAYEFLVDQTTCKDPALGNNDPNSPYCQSQTVSAHQDKNPKLKEERSLSLNFGAVAQPVRNFTVSADVWYVKVKNTIGFELEDLLLIEQRTPGAAAKYGVNFIRNNNNELKRIEYTLINAGTVEAQGVDFELDYKMPTKIGDFNFNNSTTYMGNYYETFFAELGKQEMLGQFGQPRWRNNAAIGYHKGQWSATLIGRSYADVEKRVRGMGKVVSPTQFDASVTYDPEWAGDFQLGVINLGNVLPRFDDTYGARVNGGLFRRAETFYLTYRQDF